MIARLQVFLYILLRDHLPAGTVESILKDHVGSLRHADAQFSNKHLAAYAAELAERLVPKETSGAEKH